jgi:magnesium chelatase family protein
VSGPILDRIDLSVSVAQIDHGELLSNRHASATAHCEAIQQARHIQQERFGCSRLNASLSNRDIKLLIKIDTGAQELLTTAAKRLHLSARTFMRTIKVAQTIADLAGAKAIATSHIAEAMQYRTLSMKDKVQ